MTDPPASIALYKATRTVIRIFSIKTNKLLLLFYVTQSKMYFSFVI